MKAARGVLPYKSDEWIVVGKFELNLPKGDQCGCGSSLNFAPKGDFCVVSVRAFFVCKFLYAQY